MPVSSQNTPATHLIRDERDHRMREYSAFISGHPRPCDIKTPQEVCRRPYGIVIPRLQQRDSPLYKPLIPSVLNVFQRQSMGLLYRTPLTRPVTGSFVVFSMNS